MQQQATRSGTETLSLIERQALRRTALGRGDLVPVARLFALRLEAEALVRVVQPSLLDRSSKKLAACEVWAVITNRGASLDASLRGEVRP